MNQTNLDPKTAYQTLDRYQLVDLREPQEWREGLLPDAPRLPLSKLSGLAAQYLERDKPLLLYCRSGNRSQEAREPLKAGPPQGLVPRGR